VGAQQRLEFLAEAGALAAASLDYETTLASISRLAVPFLADWCTVYVRGEDGAVRRVAVATADPVHERLAEELRRFPPSPTSPRSRVAVALETGQSELVEEIPEEYVESIAQGPEHLDILRRLAFRSSMIVPLAARGDVFGAMVFFAAASDRRYNRDDLALAEEVARRCAIAIDNARLYGQAQEAIRLRDEVLAAVSHDLKGPLTAISGQAQLLKRRLAEGGGPTHDAIESVDRITRATARLGALVNELIDVARLQAGQPLQLHLRPTDLVELARRCVAECQESAPSHAMRVETALDRLVGVWDQFRLERVIENLLGNAVKYSPGGGEVVVTIDRDDQGRAVLSVRDQGVGIPPADLPRVFERFHRGANVMRSIRGSGVGLAGARQIVEQHRGTIEAESAEGKGSTFTVRLPPRI
jgi:signal transduction histidine kinase